MNLKKNQLFCTIFLLFAFTAKGVEDETIQEDASREKRDHPNPIADYPLNEEFEARERDGKQPAGVLGEVELAVGPHNEPNGAYKFSGKPESFIEFPNSKINGGLDTRQSITLMCWVQPGGQDGPLFNYGRTGPWGVHIWIVNGRFFNRITKYPNHAFATAIYTDQPLPVGQWAHVAATYDHNTGVNSLYVDGKLSKTQNIGTGFDISTNDEQVRMGVKVGDGRHLKGKIAQMKVYDVALNEADIKAAMNEGKDPCAKHPCHNGGTCVDIGDNSYECECPNGVTGEHCDDDIDECKDNHNGYCQDICVNTVGSYYCACSDPEFSVAPDQRHCIAEGVEVDCGQDEMTITLPKSLLRGLDREHLRLIDVQCTATENQTHYFLHTRTTECGTILKNTKDHAVYSNMVSEIPIKENQIVTRVRDAMIPFYCFYSKWGVVSSIGIRPSSKKVILSSKGYGKFTISLDIFRNSQYIEPFTQDEFPVEFTIRERVFFEARVDTEDNRLTILALDCYATPSQDRNSKPRYDVIKDGCSVDDDDTLKFHPRPDAQSQRFSLEAFEYVSQNPYVFFHCQVQICNATDTNSRCAQGCQQRRRRSEKALRDNLDDIYALAQGPLTLDREKREAEVDEAVDSDESMRVAKTGFNVPIVASLGVFIGLCVMGMAWLKMTNKKKTARQYIPLYEDQE